MDEARITVLYDEGALVGTTYTGGKGFSLLVESDGEKTLFGTGRKYRYLANNMFIAGVDGESVTRAVISHGHADHWGGIAAVLREREEPLEVYSVAGAWGEKKFLGATGITVPEELSGKVLRKDVTDWVQLSEHLFVSVPMRFHDGEGEEIFLVLKSKNGPVLMSGCCHCGLDHIFEAVKNKFDAYPIAVLGGLHTDGRKNRLAGIYANYLKETGCRILYLNHCTGLGGISDMRGILGLKGVNDFYVGQSVAFPVF